MPSQRLHALSRFRPRVFCSTSPLPTVAAAGIFRGRDGGLRPVFPASGDERIRDSVKVRNRLWPLRGLGPSPDDRGQFRTAT